jgi:hypothetical protein
MRPVQVIHREVKSDCNETPPDQASRKRILNLYLTPIFHQCHRSQRHSPAPYLAPITAYVTVTATRAIISLRQHVHLPREEQIKDRITQMECGSFVPIREKFITESGFTTTTVHITRCTSKPLFSETRQTKPSGNMLKCEVSAVRFHCLYCEGYPQIGKETVINGDVLSSTLSRSNSTSS